jgi:hypothetical protein
MNRLLVLFFVLFFAIAPITACKSKGDDAGEQIPQPSQVSGLTRRAFLNDKQIVSTTSVLSAATGTAAITLDAATSRLTGSVTLSSPTNAVTAVHLNDADAGSNGAPVVSLAETPAGSGIWTVPETAAALTASQADKFKAAGFCVMADTLANPEGEIRGQLLSYADNIQLVFQTNCLYCHNASGPSGFTGLILFPAESYGNLVNRAATQSTGSRVVPFDADNSVLYQRLSGVGFAAVVGRKMPPLGPSRPVPSLRDLNLIKAWINSGAMDDNGAIQAPQPTPFRQYTRNAFLNAIQIVSAVSISSIATGTAGVVLDTATSKLTGTVVISNMTNTITSVRINDGDAGSDGALVIALVETTAGSGIWTIPDAAAALTPLQMNRFIAAGLSISVDTIANPNGEIRGQLQSYAGNVQPLFSCRCVVCHNRGAAAVFTGLLLVPSDSYALVVNQPATRTTGTRVTPFDPADSVLVKRIAGIGFTGEGQRMPVDGPYLTLREENIIRTWINMGAPND